MMDFYSVEPKKKKKNFPSSEILTQESFDVDNQIYGRNLRSP